jgi:hypothetical protein
MAGPLKSAKAIRSPLAGKRSGEGRGMSRFCVEVAEYGSIG